MTSFLRRSADWPENRFSIVERAWEGETCCVIGGGKSLTQADVDKLRGRVRVIAVNDAYRMAPWADVCYFADTRWWNWHKDRPGFLTFAGLKCSLEQPILPVDPTVHILRNHNQEAQGLSLKPDGLHNGKNSGYQAINLAVLAGVKRILLLGFDMNLGHWFGEHPEPTVETDVRAWKANFVFIQNPLIKLGVEVINCSRVTELEAFKKDTLDNALAIDHEFQAA